MISCRAILRTAFHARWGVEQYTASNLKENRRFQYLRSASETLSAQTMSSRGRIIHDAKDAREVAGSAQRVAVLGIKTESQASQPAYYVPEYLHSAGIEIIPVPVYYPEVTHILGRAVVRDLKQVEGSVDVLDVFRRPQDLPPHLPDMIALKPKVVWLQTGISNSEVESALAEAGIDVVVSRCMLVDHRAAVAARSSM